MPGPQESEDSVDCDGVGIRVRSEGEGGLPLLFVHGLACDLTFFDPQFHRFAPTRRVVALDLPGHGKSDAPPIDYTITGFARNCVCLCDRLGLDRVVAVGHSMGGAVALELARQRPRLVAGAILLDSTIHSDDPARATYLARTEEELRTPRWRERLRATFAATFLESADPELRERILERMARTPQHVVVSLFVELQRWDGTQAAAAFTGPLLYVQAAHPRTDLEWLRAACPQAVMGKVVGSGHFVTLVVPDQVNAMIDRFLTIEGL